MKLLVLGGTLFLGRHLVAAGLEHGHRVTTFTRGRTNPGLFPEAETLHGDRNTDLRTLTGRTWDVVVDTSAYVPRQAADAAATLRSQIDRYCLISTGSVYAKFPQGGANEDTVTHAPPDDPEGAEKPEAYGPLKLGCERTIIDAFGDRALVVRPGVLAGPHDPTGRLGYWVHRVAAGGEVLAPGNPEHPVQLLDARDLAAWLITLLETGGAGVFNTSGPLTPLTMDALLQSCRTESASNARLTWVDDAFLLEQGVKPWSDLPLWLPAEVPGPLLDSRRAYLAGLRCRPLRDTMRDVLADDVNIQQVEGGPPRPGAISRDRERELLRLWHAGRGPVAGSSRLTRA